MAGHAADEGAELHRLEEGGPGPRVVLVHGFTQTQAAWEPLAARLRARRRLVRVDLPGHGGSAGVRAGFAEAARLLGASGGGVARPRAPLARRPPPLAGA